MGKVIGNIIEPFTGAKAMQKAANQSAEAQAAAARQAAMAQAFRPIGFTSAFGSSQFTTETDPETGLPRVTAAGYTVAPELKAMQERLFGLTPGALDQVAQAQELVPGITAGAQQLFGLGSQYLAESPEAARQRYFNQQQALLEQPRQQEEQRLASSVFGRGRAGLNISGLGQPELTSLATARRQQDLALAAQAQQAAQQQQTFGQGLMAGGLGLQGAGYGLQTQALGPLQSYLSEIGNIEQMGQTPYNQSLQLAQLQSQLGGAAGATLGQGLSAAAQTRAAGAQAAAQANAAFMQQALKAAVGGFSGGAGGLGGGLSGMGLGGGTFGAASGYGLGSLGYGAGYGINPMGQQAQMLADQWS